LPAGFAAHAAGRAAAQGYPLAAFALGDLYTGRIFRYHVTRDELAACTWYAIASSLDKQNDWEPVQTQPILGMRSELSDRMEKSRKNLGAGQYAACGSRSAEWMAAHLQRRTP